MNTKIRTSLIAISITFGLTILKFLFYYLSGSIAVLSEAWHSFSDITTSLLVLFALWRSSYVLKREEEASGREVKDADTKKPGLFKRILINLFGRNIEVTVSLVIGIFLTFISVTLIVKVFSIKGIIIQKPLITGIIFLFLSLGSYFLFKFLSGVGRAENSAALISDGLHSKGDMVCSSLTGVSLILYYFNFNIDKWVSLAIALFILSFGIEIIINIIVHFNSRGSEFRMRYRFLAIMGSALEKKTYINFINRLDSRYNIDILKSGLVVQGARVLRFAGYLIIFIIVLAIAYDTGFQVQMDEEAVVERFGRPVSENSLKPGFHFKFPRPVDYVRKVRTKQIQELFLGNISQEEKKPLLWGMEHGEEIHFISGDNNFFNPYIIVHFRIMDLYKYLYNISDPNALIEDIAYKTLQHIFTTKAFYDVAITFRKDMEPAVEAALQKELDNMDTGIEIVSVNIKDIHPPIKIAGSFEEVIASYQKKEEIINLALEYQNSTIPSSRAAANKNIINAGAYVNEEILKARGAVVGFRSKLESYKKARPIIRKVLYFSHIMDSLVNRKKILIDPKTGKPNLYLNSGGSVSLPEWPEEEKKR